MHVIWSNPKMRKLTLLLPLALIALQAFLCAESKKINRDEKVNTTSGEYTVYIINNNIHSGIVIPVNNESLKGITALYYFKDFQFVDFGWGEETDYQDIEENYWHDVKAVIMSNPSVTRVQGYRSVDDLFVDQSDFTVKLSLSKDQFTKLIYFIDGSFTKDAANGLIITSKRYSGEVIFFRSPYRYHLFNTCNTWVAKALQSCGLPLSPFFVITAGQLYNKIKDQGIVIKSLK
jgi:uncharacterized protein (TIGR02117 family)